jgi:tetratricopeptide (TPR) repeat protein
LGDRRAALEQGFEIRLELRQVLFLLGENRSSLERLHEAGALADRLNDDRRRAEVCAFATNLQTNHGALDEAIASGARALEIAERLGDLRLRILTTPYIVQALWLRGDYQRAVDVAEENLPMIPAAWTHESLGAAIPASIYMRQWAVLSLACLGRFSEAADYAEKAIGIAESKHQALPVGWIHWAAGTVHALRGDWTTAHRLVEHGLAVLRRGNFVFFVATTVSLAAWVMAARGDRREALNRLQEAELLLESRAAKGLVGAAGWNYHALARAALLVDRVDDAQRLGERAVEVSQQYRGFAAHAEQLLGDVAIHPDRFDADRGERHYHEALALAEPRGMQPLVAHCHLGLGTLSRRKGDRVKAHERLHTATTMYREMDMTFWLEKAEVVLKELS